MSIQFDAKTEQVIEKVRKLLALAKNNPNEQEAESAANKARELLEAYNLDMAHLNKESHGAFAPRQKTKYAGGLYNWQRDLWHMVSDLNFCKYYYYKGLRAGQSYEHEVIGSKANVISTQIMASYLQDTIERLAREWVAERFPGKSCFIKPAIAYREGIASRLVSRMWQIRNDRVREEDAKRKAEREANAARGIFTENALVLSDVISTEEDLNRDFIYNRPPGTSARHRKEREAEQAAAEKAAEEALRKQAAWDEANPELAAKRKAKEQAEWDEKVKRWSKQRTRKPTPEEERRASSFFQHGYRKGEEISLNQQLDEGKRRIK